MRKLLLVLITILGLTSCSSSGFENTFPNSKCWAHVQMAGGTVTHIKLSESYINPNGVVKGTTLYGSEPIILSPGTYVLFQSIACPVCKEYVEWNCRAL